jgi:hypothetical protein
VGAREHTLGLYLVAKPNMFFTLTPLD